MSGRKKILAFVTGISAVLYLVLSFLVHNDVFRTVDYESMVVLQKNLSSRLDMPFSVLTLTGSSEIVLLIVLIILLLIYLRKKRLFFGIALILVIYLVEIFGKLLIYHPHPPTTWNRYVFSFRMPSSYFVKTNFSFPSGHMARSTFLILVLMFVIFSITASKRARGLSLTIAILYLTSMVISRVYLGDHWFSDVFGGMLLGTSVAGVTLLLF